MFRTNRTQTFYTFPIKALYEDAEITLLYFVLQNNFDKSKLTEQSDRDRILVLMIVPSSILFILSILITTFILRKILRKLDVSLNSLVDYCSLILKGDMKLTIPELIEDTEDLKELYDQFRTLNKLSQYSDPRYFDVPKPERIIRYLEAYKLFKEYGYNESNLCENIGDCYLALGDIPNAIKYLRQAISIDMENFQSTDGDVNSVF